MQHTSSDVRNDRATKRFRIAFVSNSSASIYQFRRGVILAFMEAGYEVVCIVPEDSFTNRLITEGIQLELIELDGYTRNPFQEYRYFQQLKACYQRLRPDLIFHYTIKPNIWGTFAAHTLGIRCVSVITGLGGFPDIQSPLARNITAALYKRAARRSDQVWFLNTHDEGYFEGNGWLKETTSKVLPSEGVDAKHFAYEPMPPAKNGRIKALFAGRLIRQKGVYEFAAAAKTLQAQGAPIDCYLLGFLERKNPDAIALADLEDWRKAGFITYLGETHDVRPHLADCDILVLPTFYREGVSRILLEAMSVGRPILTTNNVGSGLLVDHLKNGFLMPQHSPAAIVEALQYFARLPAEVRTRMGKKGRTMILGKYEESIVIKAYFRYVKSLEKVTA